MIYFDKTQSLWLFHEYVATYNDTSTGETVERVEYVTDRRTVEDRVKKWPTFSHLIIRRCEPGLDQQARLQEMNLKQVSDEHEGYVLQYVVDGAIDAPKDEGGNPLPLGDAYLDELVARPINHQRLVAKRRADLRAKLADYRWRMEIRGMIIDGLTFSTDDRSKTLLNAKHSVAKERPGAMHKYKTLYGWIEVPSEHMTEIAMTLHDYVQQCFDHEEAISAQIGLTEDFSTIDITAGWPSNEYTLNLTVV